MSLRRCNKCGETKPISAFHKYREGRRHDCAVCRTAATAAWAKANPEKYRIKANKWAADNRKKSNASKALSKKRHPETTRNAVAKRRALLAGVHVENVDRTVVFKRDEGICHLCKLPVDPNKWQLEHVIPICKGGEHSMANVAVSHPSCNASKGAKLLSLETTDAT